MGEALLAGIGVGIGVAPEPVVVARSIPAATVVPIIGEPSFRGGLRHFYPRSGSSAARQIAVCRSWSMHLPDRSVLREDLRLAGLVLLL